MTTLALVDSASLVVNRVTVGDDPWTPPEGLTAIEETTATGTAIIGGTWDGTVFVPPPPDPDTVLAAEAALAATNRRATLDRQADQAAAKGDFSTAYRLTRQLMELE